MFIELIIKTFTRRGRTAAGVTEKPTFEVPGCLPDAIPQDAEWTLPNILGLFNNDIDELKQFVIYGFNKWQASKIVPEAPADVVEEWIAANPEYARFYFRSPDGETVTPETVRIETVKKTGETNEVNVYRGMLMSLKKLVSMNVERAGISEQDVFAMLLNNPKFKTWTANNGK